MKYLIFLTPSLLMLAVALFHHGETLPASEYTFMDLLKVVSVTLGCSAMGWWACLEHRGERHTLTIVVKPDFKSKLLRLQSDLGMSNVLEVVRRAFALLDMAQDHQRQGGTIQFIHRDGSTETLPELRD